MNGLNKTITLSFMIVGHTKFMPDSCFGLLKQKMRRTNIECLDDIVQTINKSANVNHTQLVGTQNGEVLVPTYDWLSFFAMYFKKISNIKSYQNFIVSTNSPGVVEYKKFRIHKNQHHQRLISTTYNRRTSSNTCSIWALQ